MHLTSCFLYYSWFLYSSTLVFVASLSDYRATKLLTMITQSQRLYKRDTHWLSRGIIQILTTPGVSALWRIIPAHILEACGCTFSISVARPHMRVLLVESSLMCCTPSPLVYPPSCSAEASRALDRGGFPGLPAFSLHAFHPLSCH